MKFNTTTSGFEDYYYIINANPNEVSYLNYSGNHEIRVNLAENIDGQPYTIIITGETLSDFNFNVFTNNGQTANVIWANGLAPVLDNETDYPDEAVEIQLIKYGNHWFGTWVAYR
jgi:hypothetical protein